MNDINSANLTWMIYENNLRWAIPKRPKIVIKGTSDEIESFVSQLNRSRERVKADSSGEIYLSATPIRSFESVEEYKNEEQNFYEESLKAEVFHRSRVNFLRL